MDIEIFDNVPIIDYSIPAISGVYPEKKIYIYIYSRANKNISLLAAS